MNRPLTIQPQEKLLLIKGKANVKALLTPEEKIIVDLISKTVIKKTFSL